MAKLEDKDKKSLEEAFQRFFVEMIFSEKTPFLRKKAEELMNLGVNAPNPLIFCNLNMKFQSLTKILELMPIKEKLGSMLSQQSIDKNVGVLKGKDDRLKERILRAYENKRLHEYVGKIIYDHYKKDNPAEQSIWFAGWRSFAQHQVPAVCEISVDA